MRMLLSAGCDSYSSCGNFKSPNSLVHSHSPCGQEQVLIHPLETNSDSFSSAFEGQAAFFTVPLRRFLQIHRDPLLPQEKKKKHPKTPPTHIQLDIVEEFVFPVTNHNLEGVPDLFGLHWWTQPMSSLKRRNRDALLLLLSLSSL